MKPHISIALLLITPQALVATPVLADPQQGKSQSASQTQSAASDMARKTADAKKALLKGNEGGKGGTPEKIDQIGLQRMIESDDLKVAMRNYLDTVRSEQVSADPKWAKAKARLGQRESREFLKEDLASPYVAGGKECQETYPGGRAKAWARIGEKGGKICFNLDPETGLYADYKDLSKEEAIIRLAALAFHEHVHHAQDPRYQVEKEKEYEDEANEVGSYVEWTAKIAQLPVLEWTQKSGSDVCNNLPSVVSATVGVNYNGACVYSNPKVLFNNQMATLAFGSDASENLGVNFSMGPYAFCSLVNSDFNYASARTGRPIEAEESWIELMWLSHAAPSQLWGSGTGPLLANPGQLKIIETVICSSKKF